MYNLSYRIYKEFDFTKEEIRDLLISIIIMSLIVGWDDGLEIFSLSTWSWNLIQIFIIITITMFVNVSAKKIAGLYKGYDVKFEAWKLKRKFFSINLTIYGLLFGFIILFLSSNKVWFLVTGGFGIIAISKYKIGNNLFGINKSDLSFIAFAGLLANMLLIILFKILYNFSPELIEKAIYINISLIFFSLFLIPGFDGIKIFFGSVPLYISIFIVNLFAIILLLESSTVELLVNLFLIGFVVWLISKKYIGNI